MAKSCGRPIVSLGVYGSLNILDYVSSLNNFKPYIASSKNTPSPNNALLQVERGKKNALKQLEKTQTEYIAKLTEISLGMFLCLGMECVS